MNSNKVFNTIIIAIVILLSIGVFQSYFDKPLIQTVGSLNGNSNKSTTTDITWSAANFPTRTKVLKTGTGYLSQVVLTGATAAAGLNFYDGTTTLSHPNVATTSIGYIKASTPAGTYIFDAAFNYGLIVEFPDAIGVASSTILWN